MTSSYPQLRSGHSLAAWREMGQWRSVLDRSLFVVDSASRDSAAYAARNVVVLLHGFPTSSWDWHYQWDELAKHYRVVTFDLLGFGYSDKPHNYRYSIHKQADLTMALLRELKCVRQEHATKQRGDEQFLGAYAVQ